MRAALDTNILAYAEGVNGDERKTAALDLLKRLPQHGIAVPVQVLGELFNVLVRKARYSKVEARVAVLSWRDAFFVTATSPTTLLSATDLAADHEFGIWDAVILSASAEAGCRLLLTEDLQDGFTWNGVTVANPFADERHWLLRALLDEDDR